MCCLIPFGGETETHTYSYIQFFIFSIRPDNIYHGTLAFHFLTGNGSGEGVEEGAAHHQNRNDSQQQKQQGEEKAVVLTVRVQGGARPVIFEGVPPDGLVSAHVHCSLGAYVSGWGPVGRAAATGSLACPRRLRSDHIVVRRPALPTSHQHSMHYPADFLYIYSGKASFSDVMRLGLKGAISVTGKSCSAYIYVCL